MIDSTGKKIGEDSEKPDKEFLLAEIKFFLKGFSNNKTDNKAYTIAKSINEYLKQGGTDEEITKLLPKLEEYIEITESEDFLWQMVYIQREIASSAMNRLFRPEFCADCKYRAAQYFDKICEVEPTTHNNCCRVIEYVFAALGFEKSKENEKILPLIEKAEELFLQIPETDSAVYYTAGRLLYDELHRKLTFDEAEQELEVLKKAADYAIKLYKARPLKYNLERALFHYLEYCKNNLFSFEEEEDNLTKLIKLAENTTGIGIKTEKYISELKEILQKFSSDSQ